MACLGCDTTSVSLQGVALDRVPFGKHSHSGLPKKSFSALERFILNLRALGGFVFEDCGISLSVCLYFGFLLRDVWTSVFRNRELVDVVLYLRLRPRI